jgi:protoporphyrin/coproporphyrin ferrochelatase
MNMQLPLNAMLKEGVLLLNLGSPNSPEVPEVRRYLREFLMDGRVMDAPWPVRFCVVNFGILPKRPIQSSEAYKAVWTKEGSPLIVSSRRIQAALQARLDIPVELAMRYQNPSIESAIRNLVKLGVSNLLVIPLFPHYAMSSYETAAERAREVARKISPGMKVEVVPPYYDAPEYVSALVASASRYLEQNRDYLLFSFHGLPERHLRKADPTKCHCMKVQNCCEIPSPAHATCYRAQCLKTVRAFVRATELPKGSYSVAFQSRLGREPWMQPYTDKEIERLAKAGVKRLAVVCPAFISDCLETLEEIGIRGREIFQEAGGEELTLVPCLNDHPDWIDALQGMVDSFQNRVDFKKNEAVLHAC